MPKAVKNVGLKKEKAASAISHGMLRTVIFFIFDVIQLLANDNINKIFPAITEGSTAWPAALSDVRIHPFTSNLMREIHSMHVSNTLENNINNGGEENLGNQSIDLEHTSCCGKFCFIYVTNRCVTS